VGGSRLPAPRPFPRRRAAPAAHSMPGIPLRVARCAGRAFDVQLVAPDGTRAGPAAGAQQPGNGRGGPLSVCSVVPADTPHQTGRPTEIAA